MNSQKKKDLSYGFAMEDLVHPILEKQFGKLDKTPQCDNFDYINEDYVVELKSRHNITIKSYNSLCFNECKLVKGFEYLEKTNKKVYFAFNLMDGIWLWELTKDNKNEYYYGNIVRKDRGRFESSKGVYVYTKHFKLLNFIS